MQQDISIENSTAEDIPRLVEVWEASVRATHHFLNEEDIVALRKAIYEHDVFSNILLKVARLQGGEIVGFAGVLGDSLETLFIAPAYRGKGIGKALIGWAIGHSAVTKVEVNEQNAQAIGFYEHYGFRTVSRSDTDGFGQPYPLLYMEREIKASENDSIKR